MYAALVSALVELAVLVSRGGASISAAVLTLGLYFPLGITLGAAFGFVYGGVHGVVDLKTVWRHLVEEDRVDRALATGVLVFGGSVAAVIVGVAGFSHFVAESMANRQLAALANGIVAGVLIVVVGVGSFPIFYLLKQVSYRIPRARAFPLTVSVLVLSGTSGLAFAFVLFRRIDWRVLRFGPWIALGILGFTALTLLILISRRSEIRQHRATMTRLRRVGVVEVLVGVLSLITVSAPFWGNSPSIIATLQRDGLLMPVLIGVGRVLSDRDRDGYSAWFAGGDCDDGDATVNPQAHDIPGNGIDENCAGGDATIVTRKHAIATSKPVSSKNRFSGNVVLLFIDTLRADMLGAMGNDKGLTPHLDALARRGLLFRRAYAQASNTPQSFPSIVTSRYPSRVSYSETFTSYPVLKDDALTVFEAAKEQGITTLAATSHFYFDEKRNVRQGVDHWDNRDATSIKDSNKDIASPRIVPRALEQLKQYAQRQQRVLQMVHLFEPHSTYVTHDRFPITETGTAALKQKYEFEVKFVDEWVGNFIDGLSRLGLADTTALIVFSDHGEAFGEHRFYFHGQALYNEVLHVPVIIVVPQMTAKTIDTPVALIDIAPTIHELFSIPIPESYQGESLLTFFDQTSPSVERSIGAELLAYPAWPKAQRAMILDGYKAIQRITENRFELYHVQRDPREQHDLALSDPERAEQFRLKLVQFSEQSM